MVLIIAMLAFFIVTALFIIDMNSDQTIDLFDVIQVINDLLNGI